MADILRAILISAGILLPVVILIVGITIAAVRRGEAAMHTTADHVSLPPQSATEIPVAAKPAAKAQPAPADDGLEISVVLLLGTGLFVLTIVLMIALSMLEHAV
jgi:hypothetical protein